MAPKNDKSNKKKYQKLEEIPHIMKRPDTFIGSLQSTERALWICDNDNKFVKETINFVPGYLKIFDEILVNAYDATVENKDCDTIKVECNQEEGYITVWNNAVIPVTFDEEYGKYIPEFIFGEMRSGSNFDDDMERMTGGRNGYGSKLANIFSTKFIVEVGDHKNEKKLYTEFENNMQNKSDAKITSYKNKKSGYVKITFYPDFKTLKLGGFDDDHFKLFKRRAYDIAGTNRKKVKVYFNNERIETDSFKKYIELYYPHEQLILDESNQYWTVGAIYLPEEGGENISFVNGVYTYNGGTHCEHVIKPLIKKITDDVKKKNKDLKINQNTIRDNLVFFINSNIVNPAFASQVKEELTTEEKIFKYTYKPTDTFVNKIIKCGIVEQVTKLAEFKQENSMKKTDGKKVVRISGIPKLEDANHAGKKDSYKCSLLLVEGDSAKAYALSGISIIGRDYYGIFPLKGKLLNVREASIKKINENDEISNLKKILGLKKGVDYSDEKNFKQLRYGRIILLTDQDSVTEDTPLLLKNSNDDIEIRTINDISTNEWSSSDNKEVSDTDFMIWTESGWTSIKKVIRHKVKKKIYRILTHTGLVDVTEDHSLLSTYGTEITPNDCDIGSQLLHNFPIINFIDKYNDITEEEAFDFGMDIKLGVTEEIPSKLLNSPYNIRQKFFEGLHETNFTCNDKLLSQNLYYLAKSIGLNVIIDNSEDQNITLSFIKEDIDLKNSIKQKICLGETEQYVYDLETANHHFQAGIGEMIVHNTDGFHIKGLVMNMFHSEWPELVYREKFLTCFATPIIRMFKKEETDDNRIEFYSLSEYENYIKENGENGYKSKYYKGLGTTRGVLAKKDFNDFENKLFFYESSDNSKTNKAIELAFKKNLANKRKDWLKSYDRDDILEYSNRTVIYDDFVNKELKHFSNYDNVRSIPSLIDGLKPSQRKILYIALKKYSNNTARVSTVASSVAENAQYHHGEASLEGAIVGLAQDFCGSNNINLLVPAGQFGTRNKGGKDHASSRYIYTRVDPISLLIFRSEDTVILKHLVDEGETIEPETYFPIIPMCLINGADGIGTGYSTKCPSYNPLEVIESIKNLINGSNPRSLKPWYSLFMGKITKEDDKYLCKGIYKINNNKVIISELPVYIWTEDYKEKLEKILEEKEKLEKSKKKQFTTKETVIVNFEGIGNNNSDDEKVYLELEFKDGFLENITPEELEELESRFDLVSKNIKFQTSNIHFYNQNNEITKYTSVKKIMRDFYTYRLEKYVERRAIQLEILKNELKLIDYRVKFIIQVVETKEIELRNTKKDKLIKILQKEGYPELAKTVNSDPSYDYLMDYRLWDLTKEKVASLKEKLKDKQTEYNILKKKTEKDLWLEELEELEHFYIRWYDSKVREHHESSNKNKDDKSKKNKKKGKK